MFWCMVLHEGRWTLQERRWTGEQRKSVLGDPTGTAYLKPRVLLSFHEQYALEAVSLLA